MKNAPLISIIIPCYNDAQFIEQAIQSALNQTYTNKEVIVVDDGSNAETKDVLKKLEHKITKLITQENKGQSTARNVGIAAANGEFILPLDSDDYLETTYCEKAIALFAKHTDAKIVTCYAILLKENKSTDIYKPKGGTIENFLGTNAALGTSVFKKETALAIGGYDQNMRKGFEDWEFFIRLLSQNGKAYVIPEALYNYRLLHNTTTAKANVAKFELYNYIYCKNQVVFSRFFKETMQLLLTKLEREEKEKIKIYNKIDYKIGNFILKPFRFLKSLVK